MAICYIKSMSYDSERWFSPRSVLFTPGPDMNALFYLFL